MTDKNIQNTKIGVIGLGYVGLPLLALFSRNYQCVGFDIDPIRVQQLLSGIDTKGSLSRLEMTKLTKNCEFSSSWSDLSNCNFYIITVPTPIDRQQQPDTTALELACSSLSTMIGIGDIIVFESTVSPGTTEEYCIPLLEAGSRMKSNRDFFVGYSPERVNVGDKEHCLADTPKIVAAQSKESLNAICAVYQGVFKANIIKASSIKTAEAAKMYENVQRDVLIALANQYSEYCHAEGLDIAEVTECASTKWNFSQVGPGLVGGHCISVDPYYLLSRAKVKNVDLRLVETARGINENKARLVAKRLIDFVQKNHNGIGNLKILILGFSYKRNVSDIRNTKVADLIDCLSKAFEEVDCYDPLVNEKEVMQTYGIRVVSSPKDISVNNYDLAIVAVKHDCMINMPFNAKRLIMLEDFI